MSNDKITISVDNDLPLISAVQMFIDIWSNHTNDMEQRNKAIGIIAEINALMKNPIEYVVMFQATEQITPNDFKIINPTLKVNSNTRISDINFFYRKHIPLSPLEIKIFEIQ